MAMGISLLFSTGIDRDGRWATRLLLLTVGLLGIAHVAFLPPFEGTDERGHWSYIQQLADTGLAPRVGAAMISADVDAYPGPDALMTGGRAYHDFFAAPVPDMRAAVERQYAPGEFLNWEAEHPPLYYLLLAPFYLLAKDWSWPSHMLLLRRVSWSFAFAGFSIGCLASQRALQSLHVAPAARLLVPAWPLMFPQFFPEMARLGNDSLCLLLVSIAWCFTLRGLGNPRPKAAIGLGLSLGLGLLTKAFFWPVGAGSLSVLVLAGIRERDRRYVATAVIAAAIAIAVGGAWYLRNLAVTGSFFGAYDFILSNQAGGTWDRLVARFGPEEVRIVLRGLAVLSGSFAWAGTASLAMLPRIFTAPLVPLAILPLGVWLWHINRRPALVMAPLLLALPLLFGLLYHVLTQAPFGENRIGTPGWYFHILFAPLALALALGWQPNLLFRSLLVYAITFHAVCWATQLSVFSGCAYKPGPHMSLQLDTGSCLISPANLAVLGEPWLGGVALAGAVIAGTAALLAARAATRPAGAPVVAPGQPRIISGRQ
jgi:hypothetical protein